MGIVRRFASVVLSASLLASAPAIAAFQVLAAAALTAKLLGLKAGLYDPLAHYDSNAARWFGFRD